jgi:hypothetical protein
MLLYGGVVIKTGEAKKLNDGFAVAGAQTSFLADFGEIGQHEP